MTGTLLWLLAVAVLGLLASIALRRVAHLAGSTHDLEHLKAGVVSVNRRLAEVVDPLTGHLDEVRRGSLDPADASVEVAAALATLRDISRQARAMKAPPALVERAQQVAWEVDRAVRAADMASHGIGQLGRARHDGGIEAQTALKRGTLGLRHSREAVTRIMIGVAKLTPAEVRTMPVPSADARSRAIRTPPTDEDLLGTDGPPRT
jgi:hypothetical protein